LPTFFLAELRLSQAGENGVAIISVSFSDAILRLNGALLSGRSWRDLWLFFCDEIGQPLFALSSARGSANLRRVHKSRRNRLRRAKNGKNENTTLAATTGNNLIEHDERSWWCDGCVSLFELSNFFKLNFHFQSFTQTTRILAGK